MIPFQTKRKNVVILCLLCVGFTLTFPCNMALSLDPELQCGPGLVGLATNIESSHPKYDLKQPITTNNV